MIMSLKFVQAGIIVVDNS